MRSALANLEESHDLEGSAQLDALRSYDSLRPALASLEEPHDRDAPAKPGGRRTDTLRS